MHAQTDLPPGPAPDAGAPTTPRRRGPLPRIAAGCLGLLALGCALLGGLAFFESWQQRQRYEAGHAAYLRADCAAASGPLGEAARGEPGSAESEVALRAAAELQACEALQAAEALAAEGRFGDAVIALGDVARKYAEGPLAAPAFSRGQTLVDETAPADLRSASLCQSLDMLAQQQLIRRPGEQIPPLLHACGEGYEQIGEFSLALSFYERFRAEYPGHPLGEAVQVAFVRATLGEAEQLGAGALPAPQAVGASGSAGGSVIVLIRNDSSERLSLVFNGPEVRVETLEPCADCSDFSGAEPSACPSRGPVGRYELAPGTYDVVVKASGNRGVTPFRGSWTLEQSQEYASCFYLVTTRQ